MDAGAAPLLFVYGTLKKSWNHPIHHEVLMPQADFLGDARCRGRLYRVSWYPALVIDDRANDWVHGEAYRLRDPARTLPRIDDYEGIGAENPAPHEYERIRHPITLADQTVADAWLYVYRRPVTGLDPLPSGRFDPD